MRIDSFSSPIFICWQLTRDCDLACLHCCTDSAPGRALEGELSREQALELVSQILRCRVPYVMLCGGEPTVVPHFLEIAEALGQAGVQLKIETNGQSFSDAHAHRLARLPIRSVQVSLDGATQEVYARMRPGGSLEKALRACASLRRAGMPLEITFAPTRLNIRQAEAVVGLALELGAFRFNTGKLMRLGTAAKLWDRLEPSQSEYRDFFHMLEKAERSYAGRLELCFRPYSILEALREQLQEPPATLLILPHGKVKVAAVLPFLCADVRAQSLPEAWQAYRQAWRHSSVRQAVAQVLASPKRLQDANRWEDLHAAPVLA